MSTLKNVIKKNKKTTPKPSKFFKPPEQQTTDIVLPDDIKIELSQDFDAHRASGNVTERLHEFDRIHPVHGMNKSLKHLCTWFWIPIFGYVEAPIRLAWHLLLCIFWTLLSIITVCQVLPIRRLSYHNFQLVQWYLGAILCLYLPIPCCEAEGWPWYFLEYYFASGCFMACCYTDSLRRSWELCFPLPFTEIDYPSNCETCFACCNSLFACCNICCKVCKKCIPK